MVKEYFVTIGENLISGEVKRCVMPPHYRFDVTYDDSGEPIKLTAILMRKLKALFSIEETEIKKVCASVAGQDFEEKKSEFLKASIFPESSIKSIKEFACMLCRQM